MFYIYIGSWSKFKYPIDLKYPKKYLINLKLKRKVGIIFLIFLQIWTMILLGGPNQ